MIKPRKAAACPCDCPENDPALCPVSVGTGYSVAIELSGMNAWGLDMVNLGMWCNDKYMPENGGESMSHVFHSRHFPDDRFAFPMQHLDGNISLLHVASSGRREDGLPDWASRLVAPRSSDSSCLIFLGVPDTVYFEGHNISKSLAYPEREDINPRVLNMASYPIVEYAIGNPNATGFCELRIYIRYFAFYGSVAAPGSIGWDDLQNLIAYNKTVSGDARTAWMRYGQSGPPGCFVDTGALSYFNPVEDVSPWHNPTFYIPSDQGNGFCDIGEEAGIASDAELEFASYSGTALFDTSVEYGRTPDGFPVMLEYPPSPTCDLATLEGGAWQLCYTEYEDWEVACLAVYAANKEAVDTWKLNNNHPFAPTGTTKPPWLPLYAAFTLTQSGITSAGTP